MINYNYLFFANLFYYDIGWLERCTHDVTNRGFKSSTKYSRMMKEFYRKFNNVANPLNGIPWQPQIAKFVSRQKKRLYGNIYEGKDLPFFYTTSNCAEFHFKPLWRLLSLCSQEATGSDLSLSDKYVIFKTIQGNTQIFAAHFIF
jgi:hypothetical protein